ncbi:MAG: 4Fe-4S dicluster domain-containing protein, partial [Chloroflexota bacterium]
MPKAMLFDASKCTACRGCQAACKQWWELPTVTTKNTGSYENPPDLGIETWLRMKFKEVKEDGQVRWVFTRHACMHCTQAVCVWVCPTGARAYSADGYITIDQERCIGCGRCVMYCPFSIPRLGNSGLTKRVSAALGTPKSHTYQCIFCADRVEKGMETSCSKACPPDAIIFGERSELVARGKARVEAIKSKYPKAYLYGENELGGLHVMFVLTDSPEVHGLPVDPKIGTYPRFTAADFPVWYRNAIISERITSLQDAKPEWYFQPELVFPEAKPKVTWGGGLKDWAAAALVIVGLGGA